MRYPFGLVKEMESKASPLGCVSIKGAIVVSHSKFVEEGYMWEWIFHMSVEYSS